MSQINNNEVEHLKKIILKQSTTLGTNVEKTINDYESDLTRIIFRNINDVYQIFYDEEAMFYISRDLEGFYAKYRNLISSISVYDNENEFLGIYINEKDEFVIDTFSRQRPNELEPKDIIKANKGSYLSYFPFFESNILKGNVVVEINLIKYLTSIFHMYRIEDVQWQWLLNSDGEIIFSSNKDDIEISNVQFIADSIYNESEGIIDHSFTLEDKTYRILSAYYPLSIINHDLGIVFTLNFDHFRKLFLKSNIFRGGINLIIILIGCVLLLLRIIQNARREKTFQSKLIELKMIIENYPTGIMIRDKHGIIKMINRNGQKLLFADKDENLIGKNFDEKFLVSNKYFLESEKSSSFDKDHFIHYLKDGNEIIIYRKDESKLIAGEEYKITALIDVSPLEKSRKQESAANQAKSDFLAEMSHEIRTSMNGIVGMTESLLLGKLTSKQREELEIIGKSTDLLMTIINDILDFSKIEAGKLMLEEIPFSLNEELHISQELFKPLADEKKLKLSVKIKPGVPENIIGDPFRLRQVISNLLSNAIKFTKVGQIRLTVGLMEKYNTGLSLLFIVEDTGIGIQEDKLDKIFKNYEQAGDSTSRKFGGTGLGMTISKQLVEMMNGEIYVESPSSISKDPNQPGAKFSFTMEAHSDEKLEKNVDLSNIKQFNQVTAIILSKQKGETDSIHTALDKFGINFIYREYQDNSIDGIIFHIEKHKNLYQFIIIKDKVDNDGFTLARQLKENKISSNYPIIMISSNDKRGNYKRCKNLGIDYYLIQPYDNHEVLKIFQTMFPSVENVVAQLEQIDKIKSNLSILVADDNIINQRVAQTMFKHLGYEIDIVNNGLEAVGKVDKINYDLIFMDLLMPEKDGFAATREIRNMGKNVTIIAMTGSEEEESREAAFSSGMNDYLTKPVKVEAIKRLIIKWVSEKI
ncbi:MAG: response regulator [Bacteroidales bacterium]|nr:response regulator [Bacteroidales bacterium]